MTLTWSSCVLDAEGRVVAEEGADTLHSTASIGKVFLLCEVAERVIDGRLDPRARVIRDPGAAVADSGLWQHLAQNSLPLADVCLLVAAVSDNWGTNTLIELVGLGPVAERAQALGCVDSRLHDRVRDVRGPADPPALSTGTARELAEVARRIHQAATGHAVEGIDAEAARLVEGWLLAGVDLSLVAAPFRLDPLAHGDGPLRLWSKTGADACVRADMGVAWTSRESLAYAALATWNPGDDVADAPFARMHELGASLASRMW